MASGYMTLPLPVIGSSIWADNWSSGDMSSNGWARSSKPFYWAALWNRCFAIIDQHDHSSTGFDSGEYSGKKLDWQTQWFTTKDLDLSKSKGDRVMNPNTSEHIKDCYYFEFSRVNYVDPSNTLDYRFKESIGDNQENRVGHEFYYENPLSSPDYNGSLFILHKKGDMFPESWATGTEQNRYGLAPERLLVWNCGNENGKLCEVVSNNPPGFRPGAWEFAGFPNSDTDTYGFGGIEGYSANPFLGVLDTRGPAQHKMHYTTTNPAVFLWATWNNAIGWFQTWYSGTGTGVITIIDEPDAYDPYFRFKTADGQGSPHTSSISKKGQNYARDWQYTQWIDGYYLPYRLGKMIWISDMATAGTNNQTIKVRTPVNAGYSPGGTTDIDLRWYDSGTSTMKHYNSGTEGPDTLQLTSDKQAVLLVKLDFNLWFAYFK